MNWAKIIAVVKLDMRSEILGTDVPRSIPSLFGILQHALVDKGIHEKEAGIEGEGN